MAKNLAIMVSNVECMIATYLPILEPKTLKIRHKTGKTDKTQMGR